MGVRILHDARADLATFFCSTTDWSFGPVFYADGGHSADERAEAFLRWLRADPRDVLLSGGDAGLERKYIEWRAQEAAQWKAQAEAEAA